MANRTDQWSFLLDLSKKLKKRELDDLLKLCLPLFRGKQVYRWSCMELFENLVESKKIKFTSERKPTNWCILKDLLENIHRKDLAKELDEFGSGYEHVDFSIKDNIGKLQIERVLSENNCKVYKGIFSTHFPVVIKEFLTPLDLSREEQILEKNLFCEQMNLVMGFKHDNVLGFNDIYLKMNDHSPPRCVFDYYSNMDLAHSLRNHQERTLDTTLLVRYARQIICGLKYLHENKVLHCNLRADNILLDNSNKIKITGFSSARKLEDGEDVLELDEGVKLSMKWMPLEVVFHRQFCRASDVWSFGVVLVEMFGYGKVPYSDLSNVETIKFLSDGHRHTKPENCPDSIYYDLMRKCWLLDASERPTHESILSILDNNSTKQKIKDISLLQIVKDLNNRRSINLRISKTKSVYPITGISFLDNIPPEQIKITNEVIGEGFHGVVYKGRLQYTDREIEVALKTYNPFSTTKEEFQKEIVLMKKLSHPNIVFMIGMCEHYNKHIYLVTELMTEGSLINLLRDVPERYQILSNPQELLNVALQVCRGMVYLEKLKIIHRDLAARNILTGGNFEIFKISDFGMSVVNDDENHFQKAEKISLRWSAPEVLSNQKHGMKSDVWSYGILMVEMFSFGEIPYKEWNMQEIKPRVLGGFKHCQPVDCPDEVYVLMTKCWCRTPDKRPTFQSILSELEQIITKLKNGTYIQVIS